MIASLTEAKRLVSRTLLGQAGIHAVGLRSADDAVVVYVDEATVTTARTLCAPLEAEIGPHRLIVQADGRAKAT